MKNRQDVTTTIRAQRFYAIARDHALSIQRIMNAQTTRYAESLNTLSIKHRLALAVDALLVALDLNICLQHNECIDSTLDVVDTMRAADALSLLAYARECSDALDTLHIDSQEVALVMHDALKRVN